MLDFLVRLVDMAVVVQIDTNVHRKRLGIERAAGQVPGAQTERTL